MKSALLSGDGKYLVSFGWFIKVFDAQSQKVLHRFRVNDFLDSNGLSFSMSDE